MTEHQGLDGLDALTLQSATTRKGMKWQAAAPGVIPAWVADMDFPVAPAVVEAVTARAQNDLGYPSWALEPSAGPLAEAFAERMEREHDWRPDPGHVRSYTDINQALQVLLHVLTRPGDPVAMHVPAYPPFLHTLESMDRPLLPVPLLPHGDASWAADPDRLEADLSASRCGVLLLVNPQNPTGRAFTREELSGLADLADRHDLLVISDEIHADLVHAPARHTPFATLLPERTITLTSATKAFNLGGIRCAVAHVGPPAAREALAAQPPHLYGGANLLGVEATVAAWRHGDTWRKEVLAVLDRNRRLIAERLPHEVGYRLPEATYLAWLDMRALALPEEPADFLEREARVMLSAGPSFGEGGPGRARLNFATSAPILTEILDRIDAALRRPGS